MEQHIDVSKLKVHELRAELGKRGLDTFGTKQILMDRLSDALGGGSQASAKNANPAYGQGLGDDEPPCMTSPIRSRPPQDREDTGEGDTRGPVNSENGALDENNDNHSRNDLDHHKRKRSLSPSPRRRSPSRDHRPPSPRRRSPDKSNLCEESLDWEKSTSVFLDSYNCDLNLLIDNSGYSARPQYQGGFSLMWGGVRANYGVIAGKTFFEVRVVKHLPVENLDTLSGGAAHVLRVGWSTENAEFALGEEPQSYGYGGTGKKSCDNKFADYGCTFGEGDVIGAFLEWTNTEAILRFSVNGVDQGECYRVQKRALGERYALFPHVYVKNVEFAVNFGQDGQSEWFAPSIPGDAASSWVAINNLELAKRQHGRMPPSSKADCEVIMMIGLPGAGKTVYAENFRADHKDKQYNILGTNLILDKMKVMGLTRRRNYHGRWDVLIDKSTKCLNVLISMASMRRRNYILDQTNVYPSAQRRKMRPFEGFKRKAIVIVPTDEEFRRRIAQREKEEGKEVPESAVLEMKANFSIPKPISSDPTSVFDEVIFTELGYEESEKLVKQYNQEGQASRPPPEKRQRWDGPGGRDRDSGGPRDSRFRGGYESRDRGRDFGRDRRDDYHRSPDRRDDRGRRGEYRGGYNAGRDRSRERDRFERGPGGRDRDFYARPPGARFGGPGPGGRFAGPPGRGGFPPNMGGAPGGYGGGYGGPPRGGPMMGGGIRGGPPAPGRGAFGGSGYGGGPPPLDDGSGAPRGSGMTRGGRGAFRGAPVDRAPPGSGGDNFGNPPDATSIGGGYRGGYGSDGPSGGMGRGGGGPTSGASGSGMPNRGGILGRGGAPGRGGGRGGGGGGPSTYPMGGTESGASPYGAYPGGPAETYAGAGRGTSYAMRGSESAYPGSGRDGGYSGNVQESSYPGTGYESGYAGVSTEGNYPVGGAGSSGSGSGGTMGDGNARGGGPRAAGASGAQRMYGGAGYPSTGSEMDKSTLGPQSDRRATGDNMSLYASAASRYGTDSRPSAQSGGGPRQSRFDTKSPVPPASGNQAGGGPYSTYPPGGANTYQGGFQGNYGNSGMNVGQQGGSSQSVQPTTGGGPRGGRSRFDMGPVGNQQSSMPPGPPGGGHPGNQSQQSGRQPGGPPQQTVQQQQQPHPKQPSSAYGYGYGMPSAQSEGPSGQSAQMSQGSSGQSPYGAYGYGYGYGGGYGGGNSQQATGTSGRAQGGSGSTAPSLYASAVAEKPQSTPSSTTSGAAHTTNSDTSAAAAAYASYYSYGANAAPAAPPSSNSASQGGKYDAAMVAAQQFNAWQQNQPGSASGGAGSTSGQSGQSAPSSTNQSAAAAAAAAAAAYASYYPGYSAYGGGYGAPSAPSGTGSMTSASPANSAASMQQYYAGYR